MEQLNILCGNAPKSRCFLLYSLFLGQNVEPAPVPVPLPPPDTGADQEEENQQTEEDCLPEGSSQEQEVPGRSYKLYFNCFMLIFTII